MPMESQKKKTPKEIVGSTSHSDEFVVVVFYSVLLRFLFLRRKFRESAKNTEWLDLMLMNYRTLKMFVE